MRYIVLFFIPLFPCCVFAQIEDLTQDRTFFQDRQTLYQQWLDHSGLGQVLKVEDIKVEPEELSLYLAFQTEDVDSSMIAWKALKQTYEADFPISLEQQLFYKMVSLMEVRQSIANIQIYDTYDLKVEPLFFVGIYFDAGEVTVESSGHKSKNRDIEFTVEELSKRMNLSAEEVEKRFTKEYVFDTILAYSRKKFAAMQCENRQPNLRLLENRQTLRFEVSNLCREVLTDAANPLLCRLLDRFGKDCNWVKREKLDFTISYTPTRDGFNIGVIIDGKYGSGYYETVQRGGYMSMEIDFDEYLEVYADAFVQELIERL
jgi:hypothetical protein